MRIYRLAAGPRTWCDRPPLALLSLNPRPMRSGTRLLGLGVAAAAVVCAWLASCSRAFPFPIPLLEPYTSQKDVDAINGLYAALGSPDLAGGWTGSGGDPCREAWQGVQCDGPNVTAIDLRGAGLRGELSQTLGDLTAVTELDLSDNRIGGALPRSLPPALARLDVSSNSLGGELPDSMAKLSSLSTLHLQNNQLTGTLDVLQDLPLTDLDVENNQFSGPIPDKLLSVPKFLRDGNHFTIPPPIPGLSPTPAPPSRVAPPGEPPVLSGSHPPIYVIPAATQDDAPPSGRRSRVSPATAAGFSVLAAGSLGAAVVAVLLFTASRRRRERERALRVGCLRGAEMCAPSAVREARLRAAAKLEKDTGRHYSAAREKIERTPRDCVEAAGSSLKHSSNGGIVVGGSEAQQPLQLRSASFTLFTVASLQQHTGGFSRQDLVRETCFGKIYAADRPTGSKLSVLKLDGDAARTPVPEFLEAVRGVAGLRHPNVEQLVGCCVEHGQRLLVYRHFSDRALDGVLRLEHGASTSGPDENETLRWDARVAVALEAAKALEYLHEGAGKQVVHRHFRSEHVLVDGELRVSVSGCGLAPLVAERSDCCGVATSYEPPEAGGGAAWTPKGDVYSFGVVMLQLLTGRRPYDGARAQGERRLVPWASARLYDLAALRKMADPRLGAPPPVRSLSRFADVISRCIQQEAEFRPAMSQVAQDLRRTLEDARAGTGTGSGGSAQV